MFAGIEEGEEFGGEEAERIGAEEGERIGREIAGEEVRGFISLHFDNFVFV